MKHFTPEQIEELSGIFGLTPKKEGNWLPISDGYIAEDDMVWWKSSSGLKYVSAEKHWLNIANFPELYSYEKPKTNVLYE